MAITSANQLELLQTAEAVAREKMIDPELVVQALEESLARAAKSRYGAEMDIRVHIDRKTGRSKFTRVRTVVEDDAVENHQAEMTVAQARDFLEAPDHKYTLEADNPKMEAMSNYIKMFEITLDTWEGKFKLSQDKKNSDTKNAKVELIRANKESIESFLNRVF